MKEIYFSIKEAAEILNVSPLTLRNWDKAGKFTANRHPINNYRVYKLSSLERLIADLEEGVSRTKAENKIKKLSIQHLHD